MRRGGVERELREVGAGEGVLSPTAVRRTLDAVLAERGADVVALRRDLRAHPELGRQETRTTAAVAGLLAGCTEPRLLPGTGLVADVDGRASGGDDVSGGDVPTVLLRADVDALPLADLVDTPWRSTVEGVCHACGHDVHTAVVAGAGMVLARLAADGRLPGRVRLLFQPAEELMPGGALDCIAAGVLDGVDEAYSLHCDPRLDTGYVGLRVGPLTAASDVLTVRLSGPGGHTSRPHLTNDLVAALGAVVSQVPALLGRRVDPRAGLSLTWGAVSAGHAHNAIPSAGTARGTVRYLDTSVWETAPTLLPGLVRAVAEPYGVSTEVDYLRGVPPVVNEAVTTARLSEGVREALGVDRAVDTEQSLGGEDYAWYLHTVPGTMARLGVRRPGAHDGGDLHQGTFDPDEAAVPAGVRVLVTTAVRALQRLAA